MLNEVIDTIRLDVGKSPVNVCVYVRQKDERVLSFVLENNGSVVDLSNVAFAAIIIARNDTQTYQPLTRYGNKLMYTLHDEDVSSLGESRCLLQLGFEDGSQITSPSFSMMVEEIPLNMDRVESSDDFGILIAVTNEMREARAECVDKAEICKQYYEDSKTTVADVEKILANSEVLVTLLEDVGKNTVTSDDIDAMWNGTYIPDRPVTELSEGEEDA